jgi:hypothetical protein
VRILGVNVIKYLRKHLEEAMAAPNGEDVSSWDGTEGRASVETWTEHPRERVWEYRFPPRRPPMVIGAK